ncbi:hypothetical protein [Sporosarcina sp. A2]|uniref:hypothetical protein n=1 Tax=Sporosarcina sp. A2 TaxID=3393449 RepID=UPI003D7A8F8E
MSEFERWKTEPFERLTFEIIFVKYGFGFGFLLNKAMAVKIEETAYEEELP